MFFNKLGQLVVNQWILVIALWAILCCCAALLPPYWDDVTLDGDLAHLPKDSFSLVAEQALRDAFPLDQAKSQIVILATREDEEKLSSEELVYFDQLASRFQNAQGIQLFEQALHQLGDSSQAIDPKPSQSEENTTKEKSENPSEEQSTVNYSVEALFEKAEAAWIEAELLDPQDPIPLWNLATLFSQMGNTEDALDYKKRAISFDSKLEKETASLLPADQPDWRLFDVLTRHTPVVGNILQSDDQKAALIVLRIRNEFIAADNIRIVDEIRQAIQQFKVDHYNGEFTDLRFHVTGNAAVGGDILLAAQESISYTETLTVVLIIVILLLIYRSPILIFIPLITIGVSLVVSTWVVAMLTQLDMIEGFSWWNFNVFKTSRIFIVVILFGAGTDFCLFLISRYQEELQKNLQTKWAVAKALAGVGDALLGSALTTVFGLGMMFFADYGKYSSSGPAIAICLLIALTTCLTLSPALLMAFGPWLHWPWPKSTIYQQNRDTNSLLDMDRYWNALTERICKTPGLILVLAIGIMLIPAWSPLNQVFQGNQPVRVSYDFLNDLESSRASKQGAEKLSKHFAQGEMSPLTILVNNSEFDFEERSGETEISNLVKYLFDVDPQITKVFSIESPQGNKPKRYSPFSSAGRAKLFLKNHVRTKDLFISHVEELQGHVAKLQVVVDLNPFSLEAIQKTKKIKQALLDYQEKQAGWADANFHIAGTSASIADLREVTISDTQRIELLVIIAVFIVLILILKKPWMCVYMILSVLFTYFVTIGLTEWIFAYVYADTYQGLDWKLPLFLFVILVAIGQDYNIYLATRVLEEQKKSGSIPGLKTAVAQTGGIITSCGLIMAGTFGSMCAGTLRGIIELGFALALGVMLDTFVVRTVLMPCYLVLLARFSGEKNSTELQEEN